MHRYHDRVLLTPVHVCAVYCRFCFRREVVGNESMLSEAELAAALDYIRAHDEIWEVILSGGDPFVLSPRRLGLILGALRGIDHVKVIRIHTRVPLVAPERIDAELTQCLRRMSPVFVVLHTNHADEFTAAGEAACARLVDAGIPMLAQTVLLRGINDDAESLEGLLRRCVENRIKPYYLHHLDRAQGTAHFRTSIEAGQKLTAGLRGRVSGLCQPTYVLDIPGGFGKTPVARTCVRKSEAGHWKVEDPTGELHDYLDE